MHHHRLFAHFPTRLVGRPEEKGSVFGCVSWYAPTPEPAARVEVETCVLYMHGFPDTSVDARVAALAGGGDASDAILPGVASFSSRMPSKLEKEFVLGPCAGPGGAKPPPPVTTIARPVLDGGDVSPAPPQQGVVHHAPCAVLAVNFSGGPGSDAAVPFLRKTVSQEIEDVLELVRYLTTDAGSDEPGDDDASSVRITARDVHLVGLSTGAIMGCCLRGQLAGGGVEARVRRAVKSVVVVAACGALGMDAALKYDFDEAQLAACEDPATGHCCEKEFWVPEAASLLGAGDGDGVPKDRYVKKYMPLHRAYVDDFLALDIPSCLAACGAPPLLVLHGTDDKSIPVAEGRAVGARAAPHAEYVEIAKGNHLLSSDKPMKTALRQIRAWVERHGMDGT